MEFFHIIALTKPANWDKSTKLPVNHHFLYLPCTKVISKGKFMKQLGLMPLKRSGKGDLLAGRARVWCMVWCPSTSCSGFEIFQC